MNVGENLLVHDPEHAGGIRQNPADEPEEYDSEDHGQDQTHLDGEPLFFLGKLAGQNRDDDEVVGSQGHLDEGYGEEGCPKSWICEERNHEVRSGFLG